jgi:hypothetical protein
VHVVLVRADGDVEVVEDRAITGDRLQAVQLSARYTTPRLVEVLMCPMSPTAPSAPRCTLPSAVTMPAPIPAPTLMKSSGVSAISRLASPKHHQVDVVVDRHRSTCRPSWDER